MKTEYQLQIIQKIKSLRNNHGITQTHLSDLLNLSTGQIGNIESPKFSHKYTVKHLYIICKHLKVPFEELFLSKEEARLPKEDVIDLLISKIIEYDK